MKKYISIGFLLLMLAACLFFLMQQFNENVENNIIENFSSFDISESKEEMQDMSLDVNNETMNLDMSLDVNDEEKGLCMMQRMIFIHGRTSPATMCYIIHH